MSAQQTVAEAIIDAAQANGLSPAQIACITVLGQVDVEELAPVRPAMPDLRALICTDERHTRRGPSEAACYVSTYLGLAERLRSVGASLGSTLFVDRCTEPRGVVAQAWADIAVGDGIELERATPEGITEPRDRERLFAWSETLIAPAPLHALRVLRALARGGDDPAIGRRTMQAWFNLGNPSRAAQCLPRCGLSPAEAHALERDLTATHHELEGQSATCLRANLNHLRQVWPELADALARTDATGLEVAWLPKAPWRLDLARPRSPVLRDDYPLIIEVGDQQVLEHNRPCSPLFYGRRLEQGGDVMSAHACIGDLTRLDAAQAVLHNRLTSNAPRRHQWIYALAPSLPHLRRLAEVEDLRPWFTPRHVDVHWGPQAEDEMLSALRSHPGRPLPRLHYAVSSELDRRLDRIAQERLDQANRYTSRVESYDAAHRSQAILAKLERGEPLTLWASTSIHTTVLQYTARDLKRGFEALGHRFELMVESHERELANRLMVHRSLAETTPDVIVLLDHLRPEFLSLLPQSVPAIAWILDELPQLTRPDLIDKLGPLDLTFAWSPALAERYREVGHPWTSVLPFATAQPEPASRTAPVLPAIAFATHLSLLVDPEYAEGFVARIEQTMAGMPQLPSGTHHVVPTVNEVIEAMGLQLEPSQHHELCIRASAVARHLDRLRVADALLAAELPLRCYGRGWAEIERFAPYAHGIVEPGEPLRELYRTHAVVLHINNHCNIHPRVLEAMAVGGFVLARSDGHYDQAEGSVAENFELGREICLFSDIDDLIAKARRALDDPDWRQSIVEAGRARVLASHTYEHRAQTMLDELRQALKRHLGRDAA